MLAPAVLFAFRTGLPRSALRLHPVGPRTCLLGALIGMGALPGAIIMGRLSARILGYDVDLADRYSLDAFLLPLLTAGVAGPVCEEFLFRGYILAAYERAFVRPAPIVLAVSGLFTVYHLSLIRLPGVGLLGLVFTYLALRSGSVWPGIAAHVGANATVIAVASWQKSGLLDKHPTLVIAVGIVMSIGAIAGLFSVPRLAAAAGDGVAPSSGGHRGWWPLYIVGAIWLVCAVQELRHHRYPQREPRESPKSGRSTVPKPRSDASPAE